MAKVNERKDDVSTVIRRLDSRPPCVRLTTRLFTPAYGAVGAVLEGPKWGE
jgi:hypothetical protein